MCGGASGDAEEDFLLSSDWKKLFSMTFEVLVLLFPDSGKDGDAATMVSLAEVVRGIAEPLLSLSNASFFYITYFVCAYVSRLFYSYAISDYYRCRSFCIREILVVDVGRAG